CLATARAFGASADEALTSAVALELLHNAFLVHDDVEDESDERRGRPTLHAIHGVPVAINVGDALVVLGIRALTDNRRTLGTRLAAFLSLPRPERRAADVRWVRERMAAYGCVDYARQVAHALAGAARHECTALYAGLPRTRDREFIEALPGWVLARN